MGSYPAMMNPIGRSWQHRVIAGWGHSRPVGSCGLLAERRRTAGRLAL